MKPWFLPLVCLTLSSSIASACPLFQGKYVRAKGTQPFTLELATKVIGGVHRYSFNGGGIFLVADGRTYKVETDAEAKSMRIICDAKTVKAEAKTDGRPLETIIYKWVDATHLEVHGTGRMSLLNGAYVKK